MGWRSVPLSLEPDCDLVLRGEAALGALADLGFTSLDDDPDNPAIITGHKAALTAALTATRPDRCGREQRLVEQRSAPRASSKGGARTF